MIDKRELLDKSRERNLTLGMIEKDYVLGWMLFGFSKIKGLTFKGGTALSKVYFPRLWRLSEDLDFVFEDDFNIIAVELAEIFDRIWRSSGIKLILKAQHSNPDYLQLKVQYDAVLGKNWIKIDVTREAPIDRILSRKLSQRYSDYPSFKVRVETLEEIGAEKIRSLVERKKCRDYYDVWQLTKLTMNKVRLKTLLGKKFQYKGIEFKGLDDMFPSDLLEILEGYWERELARLVYPVPEMKKVISDVRNHLKFLEKSI